jgi:hypothetical protein
LNLVKGRAQDVADDGHLVVIIEVEPLVEGLVELTAGVVGAVELGGRLPGFVLRGAVARRGPVVRWCRRAGAWMRARSSWMALLRCWILARVNARQRPGR